MEPNLIRLVDGLLDRIAAKDRFDLIGDYAAAIPVEVIGNLLDVPHQERGPLRDWSLAILGALEPVIEPWWQRFSGPFLYYPGRRLVPSPLRAFIDFVKALPAGRV